MLDAQCCLLVILCTSAPKETPGTALGPSKEKRAQLGIQRKEGLA